MSTARSLVWDGISAWVLSGGTIVVDPTPPTIYAGAAALGSTAYPIPVGTSYYVDPAGNDTTGTGSQAAPWATIQKAMDSVASGSTIVLGVAASTYTFHEALTQNDTKTVTIQPFPLATVRVDGAETFSSWTSFTQPNGSTAWRTAWTLDWLRFPVNSGDAWKADDPAAGHPEQVWIDDIRVKQLVDGTANVAAGQFVVNQTANTLTIGTDPTGKTVRISTLQRFLHSNVRVTLRGFEVTGFSPTHPENPSPTVGYCAGIYLGGSTSQGLTSAGSVLENMIFRRCAQAPVWVVRPDIAIRSCTFEDLAASGLMTTQSDRILVEKVLFRRINRNLWWQAPACGAIKMTRTDQPLIRWCYVDDFPICNGIWFDVSCTRTRVAGCYVDGRDKGLGQANATFFQEISDGGNYNGVQHKNYWVGNVSVGSKQSRNIGSGYTEWWNNRFEAATIAQMILQQDRPGNDGSNAANKSPTIVPWRNVEVGLFNNDIGQSPTGAGLGVIAYSDAGAVTLTGADLILGWGHFARIEGNWFRSYTAGGSMFQLGKADKTRTAYNTLSALAGSLSDPAVGGNAGSPPTSKLGTNYQGGTAPPATSAKVVPDEVAALLGVTPGTRMVGPNPANLPTPVN